MTPETFTHQWAQIRQHLRGWWDQLTERDLEQIAGQHDELVRLIQERYRYLRERAQAEIDQRLHAYQTMASYAFGRRPEPRAAPLDGHSPGGQTSPHP